MLVQEQQHLELVQEQQRPVLELVQEQQRPVLVQELVQ